MEKQIAAAEAVKGHASAVNVPAENRHDRAASRIHIDIERGRPKHISKR
ncbi:hypothetical protein Q2379_26455, partial [Escherichia coli]|nr:hypothetical protein [Escherichia coli]